MNILGKFIGYYFFYFFISTHGNAQNNVKANFSKNNSYAGIEIGSKGVKLSIIELGKNAKKDGTFKIIKDTSINTDFISFTKPTFKATLDGITSLFLYTRKKYEIPSNRIFTLFSSGVKAIAEKEDKMSWAISLSDSFRLRINEPTRTVNLINVLEEARLSHLGIVPENRRFTTFLIDIGSGNTKGGYFPNGNTVDFKLFDLNWGTKSTANETEKRCLDDKTILNFTKNLKRVINGAVDKEVTYAINVSGAYEMSDYVAISGGIAWSVANLIFPELLNSSVVPVTYDDVANFYELLSKSSKAYNYQRVEKLIDNNNPDKYRIIQEINRVNNVFDQQSLLSGAALMLKIMRQFAGVYEKKQFFLVKNGQVGWISAFVDSQVQK